MGVLDEAGYAGPASVGIAGGVFALLFLLVLLFSVSKILIAIASFSFNNMSRTANIAEQISNHVLRIGQVLVLLLTLCFICNSSSPIQGN